MVAQKYKKKLLAEMFFIFEVLLTPKPTNQDSQLRIVPDRKEDYEKNQKRDSRELFLPENDFETSSTLIFQNNIQILEDWKPTGDMKFRLEFFCTCPPTYKTEFCNFLSFISVEVLILES